MTERGRFIVFEGGEGTGKSTQARLLADALGENGVGVVLTREPGGAPGAEALRRLLIEAPPTLGWAPLSEALLYYAARNEHIEKTIRPALARGTWVISDRFADSTAAYQGAGLALGVNVFVIKAVANVPMRTVFAGVTPFIAADSVRLLILTALPVLTLWLPKTMR